MKTADGQAARQALLRLARRLDADGFDDLAELDDLVARLGRETHARQSRFGVPRAPFQGIGRERECYSSTKQKAPRLFSQVRGAFLLWAILGLNQ